MANVLSVLKEASVMAKVTHRKELEKEGWEMRSVLDEPRLSEAVELYKELGFEVKVLPFVPAEFPGECAECMKGACDRYKVIYTCMKPDSENS
jgi:hypothetical protein